MAGSIYAAKRLDNTAPKKLHCGGEPLAALCFDLKILTCDVVLEDRFVKFLVLASALVGFGFYAVLGSMTLHFQNFNLATCFH